MLPVENVGEGTVESQRLQGVADQVIHGKEEYRDEDCAGEFVHREFYCLRFPEPIQY